MSRTMRFQTKSHVSKPRTLRVRDIEFVECSQVTNSTRLYGAIKTTQTSITSFFLSHTHSLSHSHALSHARKRSLSLSLALVGSRANSHSASPSPIMHTRIFPLAPMRSPTLLSHPHSHSHSFARTLKHYLCDALWHPSQRLTLPITPTLTLILSHFLPSVPTLCRRRW